MFELFDRNHIVDGIQRATAQPASQEMLYKRIRKDLDRVISYMRNRYTTIAPDHTLVKVLNGLNLDPSIDIFDYYEDVRRKQEDIAKASGINTRTNRALSNERSFFYGPNVTEVFILSYESVDLLTIEDEAWEDLTPIKVLRHDVSSFDMTPLGRNYHANSGFAVIEINIPLLAIQYRAWHLDQLKKDPEFLKGSDQFVGTYPVANMMTSHIEHVLFNRLYSFYTGERVVDKQTNLPFALGVIGYKKELDKYLYGTLTYLNRKSSKFYQYLSQLKMISSNDAFELMSLPARDVYRQTEWIYVMARMKPLSFMLRLDYDLGGQSNRQELNVVRRYVRSIRSGKLFQEALPGIDGKALTVDLNETIVPYV